MKPAKTRFLALIAAVILTVLSACTNGNNNSDEQAPVEQQYSELIRTGEFVTAEQMETLKTAALSWQSERAGPGKFAEVVAIEPSDGSEQ